jgi:hypothetical protein
MTFARSSIVVLAVQLALVSSIAAKYLYERHSCPRVWTRAVAYDPELVMRGRYLSMQLHVDACGVAKPADNRRNAPAQPIQMDAEGNLQPIPVQFFYTIASAKNGKLVLQTLKEAPTGGADEAVTVPVAADACANASLSTPVDFYIPEHAEFRFPPAKGTTLWVEVTVPPQGPPRPINLAISEDGKWTPQRF